MDESAKRVLASVHEVVGRGHAERLVPMIAGLLGSARADAVSVDCGPGSFTGVRVGLAAARALALAWAVPVSGFSSLALIAVAAERQQDVAVAISGGHGELFVQRFSATDRAPVGPVRSLTPAAAALAVDEALVLGSGAAQLVAERGRGHAEDRLPNAAHWLLLPVRERSLPPSAIYGRPPDATPGSAR